MEFQVAPSRLSRARRRTVLLPALVALLIVAAAVAGRLEGDGGTPEATAQATAAAVAEPAQAPAGVSRTARPRLPPIIRCGAVPRFDCRRAVIAALDAVLPTAAPVRSAELSRSLICGDEFDCPSRLLRESRPVGSVVLRFADADETWVNVVEPDPDGVREGSPRALVARVVRARG